MKQSEVKQYAKRMLGGRAVVHSGGGRVRIGRKEGFGYRDKQVNWVVEASTFEGAVEALRQHILAEAAKTECCKACHGSGRVLDDEASVLKTTCMACLGTGRVDKPQQR